MALSRPMMTRMLVMAAILVGSIAGGPVFRDEASPNSVADRELQFFTHYSRNSGTTAGSTRGSINPGAYTQERQRPQRGYRYGGGPRGENPGGIRQDNFNGFRPVNSFTPRYKILVKTTVNEHGEHIETIPVGGGGSLHKTLVKTTVNEHGEHIETTPVNRLPNHFLHNQHYKRPTCYGKDCYKYKHKMKSKMKYRAAPPEPRYGRFFKPHNSNVEEHYASFGHTGGHKSLPTARPVNPPPTPRPERPTPPPTEVVATNPPTPAPTIAPTASTTPAPLVSITVRAPLPALVVVPNPTARPTRDTNSQQQQQQDNEEPTLDFRNFKPPKTVIERTPPPTSTPTFAPTPAPTKTPVHEKTITTDTIVYETVSYIDLVTVEREFFEQVQWLFTSFLAQHVGSILQTYKLTLTFMESTNEPTHFDIDDAKVERLFHNVFEAEVRFELEGKENEINAFTKKDAEELVLSFFKGDSLVQLLDWLSKKGIAIKMLRLHDPSNPPIPRTGDEEPPAVTAPQGGSNSGSNAALIAPLVCGLTVLIAIGIVILVKRKRAKRFQYYGQSLESPLNSLYSSGSESGSVSGSVKRAAIQRHESDRSSSSEGKDLEGDYDDPFPSFDPASLKEPVETLLLEPNEAEHDSDPANDFLTAPPNEAFENGRQAGYAVGKNDSFLADQEPTDYGRATLTSLDGEGSLNGLDSSYPEFEMFVNVAHRQDDGVMHDAHYTDAYNDQRRRWQEEVNDSALFGLPDHGSSSGRGSSWSDRDSGEDLPPIT